MRIHLLRHGEAVPRDAPGITRDAERPLTQAGREQISGAAEAIQALDASPDLVVASPYVRARQTAKVAAETFDTVDEVGEFHELRPEADPVDTRHALAGIQDADDVLLCGHKPHLPRFTSYLLTGDSQGLDVAFPKASLVTIDILIGAPEALGTLVRHVPYEALHRLA